jgi:hypothetical protein
MRWHFLCIFCLSVTFRSVFASDASLPAIIEFNRDVRPILSEACFTCHGPDANKRQGDLRLDTEAGLFGAGSGMAPVVAGMPEKSELLRRVTSVDHEQIMPPVDSGKNVSLRDIAILKTWIEQGAKWQGHWAYLKPVRSRPTRTQEPGVTRNEIDQFVLEKLNVAGLKHASEADHATLIRRLSFDLTGLPPTPEHVAMFVSDTAPDAYENVIERLLESPHFGERMASYWLDLVRFADTIGYHSDNPRDIAPYRDYVIRSFNDNLPFDVFTIEQIAGDLLPSPSVNQKVASGYNRLLQTTQEGGAQAKEYLAKYASDRVRNVSAVWLGATMGCAECHDHKYDPYSQRDFYSMAAFFADVDEAAVGLREPGMPVPSPAEEEELTRLALEVSESRQSLVNAVNDFLSNNPHWETEIAFHSAWQIIKPVEIHVLGQSQLIKQDDDSFLSTGTAADEEAYVFAVDSLSGLSGIRLEVLADNTLPANGPGMAPDGNFVLTEFKITILDADGKTLPVPVTRAVADHSQVGQEIAKSIDGNDQTGWGILPQPGQAHEAIFEFERPLNDGKTNIFLEFKSKLLKHGIGKLRISGTRIAKPTSEWVPPVLRAVIAKIAEQRNESEATQLHAFLRERSSRFQPQREDIQKATDKRDALIKRLPTSLITKSVEPRMTRILPRGNWLDDSGEVVQPGIPGFLGKVTVDDRQATRLELAHWIVSAENPLTARVFVNRLWKLFYGQGLSKSLEDLGSQGEWPTHPELLDHLAVDFRESGWNVKQLVRQLVSSGVYRQSSVQSSTARAVDPFNRLLSAQNRLRLDAEFIRDNALTISGLMSWRIGGESDKPYQPEGYWEFLNFPRRTWEADKGERQYRRGIYTWWQRSFLHPSLSAFDAPSREECTADRPRSNTPQQALTLLNDPSHVEAARMFAARILLEGGETDESRLIWAFGNAVARPPKSDEAAVLLRLLSRHRKEFRTNPGDAESLSLAGDAPSPNGLDKSDLAAWTSVTRTLLNLHETITRP